MGLSKLVLKTADGSSDHIINFSISSTFSVYLQIFKFINFANKK